MMRNTLKCGQNYSVWYDALKCCFPETFDHHDR